MGVSEGGDGNPGGPSFLTTDITDLNLKFHVLDNNKGTGYGLPLTIQWEPLTSADSTNQNPVQQ
jgi:hypothetical protein